MRKFPFFLVCMWTIVMIASPLYADMLVRDYYKMKDSEAFKAYVYGVGVAYACSNAMLGARNQPLLYCQPVKLALVASNYMDILNKEIADSKSKYPVDLQVELILLIGLQKTFPCEYQQVVDVP